MRRLPYIVFLICTIAACTGNRVTETLLQKADSLMDIAPDSVYRLLDSLCDRSEGYSRSLRMRCELLKAKAQNKAYVDFTTDSVMLQVADYYDSHGTPNERMLAHYLLGCAYRDLKEAPMSLQCYYDAVESADTTSTDCDYATMMRIYGQIADLLDKQYLPMEELEAWDKYQKYALLSGDTLNYILGLDLKVRTYNVLGDTANILKTTSDAVRLFKKYGYIQHAAMVLPSAIYVWLDKHNYSKAHQLQQIYETQSGLFDEEGNIAKGKEHYYCGKGLYYEGIGKLDSAEYFYRKLFNNGYKFEAEKGLVRIYQIKDDVDTVKYYLDLLCRSFDEDQSDLHAQAMHQVVGMYNYTRNQKIVIQKEKEVQRNRTILYTFVGVIIIGSLLTFSKYRKYKNRKFKELREIHSKYLQIKREYDKANEELHLIETDRAKLQEKKQAEIDCLKDKLHIYETQIAGLTHNNQKEAFMNSEIVLSLKDNNRMVNIKYEVTKAEWEKLYYVLKQSMPALYSIFTQEKVLSHQEFQICILTLMNVSTKEISYMLHSTPSRVSNAKASINQKLFYDVSGAQSLYQNIMQLVYKE